MTTGADHAATAAELYLRTLAANGVDYIFANAGTDFPPIIEALAHAASSGTAVPKALAIPHENVATAMAYGHAMVSGRAQAVMVHVNVGTANALCGMLDAARARVPMLVAAGRTPFTDQGHAGSRNLHIHWAQEMFDQGGIVREAVKWDYVLAMPEQAGQVVSRALSIARSEPQGPVYLMLPREVLAAPAGDVTPPIAVPARVPTADPVALAEAAAILARAERPVIITSALGRDPLAVPQLAALAERFAIPVVSHLPTFLSLPTDHPMHLGFDPAPFLADADAILVLECDVPWVPSRVGPRQGAKVIHLGVDPLYARYPMWNFPVDLAITGAPVSTLPALAAVLNAAAPTGIAARRDALATRRAAMQANAATRLAEARAMHPIHPLAVAAAIDAVKGPDAIVVSELGASLQAMRFTRPGTAFAESRAGGLGWALGAALGAKLAAPDRLVIATMGDGSYMFGNPTPAHFVSRAYDIPTLTIVMNNGGWAAVHNATTAMYPGGIGATANRMPLTALDPSPDFERLVEASGGHGERVETIEELGPALARAVHIVTVEKRQALLNVICRRRDREP